MSVRKVVGIFGLALLLSGCAANRELVGHWTAVDTKNAPKGLERLDVPDESHINLTDSQIATYEMLSGNNVRVNFPNGESYQYSFTRSGENLTWLDGKLKTLYIRDQN